MQFQNVLEFCKYNTTDQLDQPVTGNTTDQARSTCDRLWRMESSSNLESMIAFGFSADVCRSCLESCNNDLESAINLALMIQTGDGGVPPNVTTGSAPEDIKMIILVNDSLNMSAGKVASQCCHACLGAYRQGLMSTSTKAALVQQWESIGEKIVTLSVPSMVELQSLCDTAKNKGLNVHECMDAGRTEVDVGARTVIAIGPHKASEIDPVTGHLRLYGLN